MASSSMSTNGEAADIRRKTLGQEQDAGHALQCAACMLMGEHSIRSYAEREVATPA